MINDFTFLYGTNKKVNNAFGPINSEMLLSGAKRIFGGREKVFFEYARDETFPSYDSRKITVDRYNIEEEVSGSGSGSALSGSGSIYSGSGSSGSGSIYSGSGSGSTSGSTSGSSSTSTSGSTSGSGSISGEPDINGLLISENGNAAIGLVLEPIVITGSSRYDVEYIHEYCRTPLLDNFSTFETKKYFSIDLSYILAISRAMTTYDFSQFDGEGLRILKAWLFVMTYGTRHPDDESTIMLQSSKNEYGEESRDRVIIRNLYYDRDEEDYSRQGSPYGESNDSEWALSGDDYSRVAALDKIFTELSKGTSLYYDGSIVPDLINGTRQYGDLVPEYLNSILNMKNAVNSENYK